MQKVWLNLLLIVGVMSLPAYAQDEQAGESNEQAVSTTQYIDLKPAFVVNYGGVGRLRYLKTSVTLRVGDASIAAVRRHMPYIRHLLVMLLSKASVEDVSSMEGREMVRQSALQAIQDFLSEEEGQQQIVDLLFNSFIVQR